VQPSVERCPRSHTCVQALSNTDTCDALVGDHEARVDDCDVTRFGSRVVNLTRAVASHDGSCVILSPVNESASVTKRASVSERCLACASFPCVQTRAPGERSRISQQADESQLSLMSVHIFYPRASYSKCVSMPPRFLLPPCPSYCLHFEPVVQCLPLGLQILLNVCARWPE